MKVLSPVSKMNKSSLRLPIKTVKTKRNYRLHKADKNHTTSLTKKTKGSSSLQAKKEFFKSAETDEVIKLPEVNASKNNQGTSPNNISIKKSNSLIKIEQASQKNTDLI
jgi:hypothetical protein